MKATGALASLDSDFLLPYATHLVRSTASTSSSNCLEWSTRCLISMTRRGSLTAALSIWHRTREEGGAMFDMRLARLVSTEEARVLLVDMASHCFVWHRSKR